MTIGRYLTARTWLRVFAVACLISTRWPSRTASPNAALSAGKAPVSRRKASSAERPPWLIPIATCAFSCRFAYVIAVKLLGEKKKRLLARLLTRGRDFVVSHVYSLRVAKPPLHDSHRRWIVID